MVNNERCDSSPGRFDKTSNGGRQILHAGTSRMTVEHNENDFGNKLLCEKNS